ncbi:MULTISPECIES: 16S rRNA (adenine(1518)-N(6)/adenine(1519)-N(6))-dimethyltransferase RsmA [Terrabacteria group]|uniref:16S rRNA (adenine(1518)-N(6)/adenine(1519)-N(6))- dimethyltransferase RsmA n=1 Tax=Bacillati TaxID=1783272 RepID=UPI001C6EAC7F|nr:MULTISPECIES: 16S rRNA (adenine(1518)-N(6)/adenine(1519)-N(6))-dimethyltransferase RsmA [Terrabacteria group]MBW9212471.1 16S rRNA (adenine(1518)-N(6)/adenine(1519)-N(6))-dimethyltransferase RsmA [Trueperella sp. zg.1013]
MAKAISTPSRTKEILEQYQLKAKKNFGQNFLVDPIITKRVANEANVDGVVLEVGPGIGSLTEQLAYVAKKVIAYEIDLGLKEVLADNFSEFKNVEIQFQDFLKVDLREKIKEWKKQYGKVVVCANLPYYITSAVLFKVFAEEAIETITVMVQKEVGDRFNAKVNDSEYSALSVEGQSYYDIKKLFTVPSRSFNPSPKVDSVIIQFQRKAIMPSFNREAYFGFVRDCFGQRRKTIRNNLQKNFSNEEIDWALTKCGIEAGQRPQNLSACQYQALFEVLYAG